MEEEYKKLQDSLEIINIINNIGIFVDNLDWNSLKSLFNDEILLDYTSMIGGEPANMTPEQIIESWKELLPGFDFFRG